MYQTAHSQIFPLKVYNMLCSIYKKIHPSIINPTWKKSRFLCFFFLCICERMRTNDWRVVTWTSFVSFVHFTGCSSFYWEGVFGPLTLLEWFTLHFPKLPKFAKASCLGCTMVGFMPWPIPMLGMPGAPCRPIPAGIIFMPTSPWLIGIPPIPTEPIPMVPVAIVGGIPMPMVPPAIMGFTPGLGAAAEGWAFNAIPAKFWVTMFKGGWTPKWEIYYN